VSLADVLHDFFDALAPVCHHCLYEDVVGRGGFGEEALEYVARQAEAAVAAPDMFEAWRGFDSFLVELASAPLVGLEFFLGGGVGVEAVEVIEEGEVGLAAEVSGDGQQAVGL